MIMGGGEEWRQTSVSGAYYVCPSNCPAVELFGKFWEFPSLKNCFHSHIFLKFYVCYSVTDVWAIYQLTRYVYRYNQSL